MRDFWARFIVVVVLFGCTTPENDSTTTVEYLNSPALEELNLPFSEAVRVDNMLYLSGQIGNIPGQMKLVEGGIEEETRQTLEKIKSTLQRHGADLDDVVKCTIFWQISPSGPE